MLSHRFHFGLDGGQFRKSRLGIAVVLLPRVRIADIEVVAARLDLIGADLPGAIAFLSASADA